MSGLSEDTSGLTSYTYDNNGNQRSKETPANDLTTFTWTYENQMAGIEQPDNSLVTYTYAPVDN
ncbi:hypothetical protein [Gimesia maris]|uniref:hypothetical protein n=1 Tax=Gimesia maris TaxID=122 RepID=UPI0012B95F71|nr:hypothetical protein [Gimesia maris]